MRRPPVRVVLLAGCGRDQPLGPWTTRVDSAGIEIITISMPDKRDPEFWSSDVILRLDIGMAEGPDHSVLTGVVGAARMSDRRIVVADGGSNELRFFELDGEFAGRVGGDGEGPGEFRFIAFLAVSDNDSIVAYDRRLRRLSVLAPSGVREASVTHRSHATEHRRHDRYSCAGRRAVRRRG